MGCTEEEDGDGEVEVVSVSALFQCHVVRKCKLQVVQVACVKCCHFWPARGTERETKRERGRGGEKAASSDAEVDDDVAPIVATLSQGNTLIMLQV